MTPEHDVSQLAGDGPVSWETKGRVQVIRLGSPPANAIGRTVLDGLSGALDAFQLSHPQWRSTPPFRSQAQTSQSYDCFFDLISLRPQFSEHLIQVHCPIIAGW